jgi:DNA-directed RNA polymerase subunit RPC12/RpoP/predicted RNA-binding Zn-ribbon protein involved in translation (DUF1610 family)
LRITPDKMSRLDGKTCFICGKYLLNATSDDMAYIPVHTGESIRARPERYHLFACPNCGSTGHKRCWYNIGERKFRKGWFGKEWQLACPSCGHVLSERRGDRVDWKKGYQIPGHPDEDLLELHKADVIAWKAGSVFRSIGRAVDGFFKSVGLGSLNDPEQSAVARAAARIGKTIQDVAQQVFKLDLSEKERAELKELKCQNCGAPLPLPGEFDDAVVCAHCGTAHLL